MGHRSRSAVLGVVLVCTSACRFLPSDPYTQSITVGVVRAGSTGVPTILVSGCPSDEQLRIEVGNGDGPDADVIATLTLRDPARLARVAAERTGLADPGWEGAIDHLDPDRFWVRTITDGSAVGVFDHVPRDDTIYSGVDDDPVLGVVGPTTTDALRTANEC